MSGLATSKYCGSCNKEFIPKWNGPAHYCSRPCRDKSMMRRTEFSCKRCGKTKTVPRSAVRAGFCSKECSSRQPRPGARKFKTSYRSARLDKARLGEHGKSCRVCGFDRVVEQAHILPAALGGTVTPGNLVALCPNHHRLFDSGNLTMPEMRALSEAMCRD